MKLLLLCSARYQLDTVYILLLDTLFVRYSHLWFDERIELSKRNSLSERSYVLFSIYWIRTKWPTLSYSLEAKSLKSSHIHRISMRDVARSLSDRFSYGPTIIDCWPQKRLLMNVKPSNLLINAPIKMPKARITWLWKSLLCRNGIVVFTYSHLNTRGGWENLRKLCKPETQSRVRITFKKFSNLLNVLMRGSKHRKKVLCCLNSNRLPTKLSRHICSCRISLKKNYLLHCNSSIT